MNAIFNFITENLLYIAIIISIIVGLLVYIKFKDIDLNKIPTKKLTQTVTVDTYVNRESFSNGNGVSNLEKVVQDFDFSGQNSFCESYRGNSPQLNVACNELTDENCSSIPCCVLVQGQNGNKCMAGGINGPTFKKDANGNLISMDAYYYEGKQYSGAPTSV
jgi:hypothetical protein